MSLCCVYIILLRELCVRSSCKVTAIECLMKNIVYHHSFPFMPAGLTTVCASGFLSVLIVCVSPHTLWTHTLTVCLNTSLSPHSSVEPSVVSVFHLWGDGNSHGSLTFFCLRKHAVTLSPFACVMPFMPRHAPLKCFDVIACFLCAFHQKLGHSFVDIKTYCRPAFDRGQCQFWWESKGKGKRGMFVCLPAIGACSDCERPLPLLGNIIH